MVNVIITLLLHFSSVKIIITTLPNKYFVDIPVQVDMNNEAGSRCFHRMWVGDENQRIIWSGLRNITSTLFRP